jgi:hypothetical protein
MVVRLLDRTLRQLRNIYSRNFIGSEKMMTNSISLA